MQSLSNFANDLVTDFQTISNEKKPTEKMQRSRLLSIFARVIGAVCTIDAAVTTLQFVAGASVAPTILISAVVSGLLGYDLIRMGYNIRKVNNAIYPSNNSDESLISVGMSFFSNGANLVGALGKEAYRKTPYVIHDTIICEPIYRLFKGV